VPYYFLISLISRCYISEHCFHHKKQIVLLLASKQNPRIE
jgi:hypothetical protein